MRRASARRRAAARAYFYMPVGRNDPCPCGSGTKYKRCHGAELVARRSEVAPANALKAADQELGVIFFRGLSHLHAKGINPYPSSAPTRAAVASAADDSAKLEQMTKSPRTLAEADDRPAGSDRLRHIGDTLRSGGAAPTITVRQFLEWFGATRRGQWIVSGIRQSLDKAGIVTKPDFEEAFIESTITFEIPSKPRDEVTPKPPENSSSVLVTEPATPAATPVDPTFRLSRLRAANSPPVSARPDSPVVEALTLMLKHEFSQLPVMTNDRSVRGMVSWRSIGARWALDHPGQFVRDFMDDAYEVPADRSIFAALPIIVEHGYVLVRDAGNRISGIVTTSDLSLQFQQLTEPFLLLGEIENHIRRLIDKRFTKVELADAKDPGDTRRVIARASDMTFGEYLRLLQDVQRWTKLALPIDRSIFVKDLDQIRQIRNDVMHFDPDPLGDQELDILRQFVKFLQSLQSLGV